MGRFLTVGLMALAVVTGGAWWVQAQAAEALRAEMALLREEQAELARLRIENERLAAGRVPADELVRLRGDHAAVARLRAEIEKLKRDLQERERAVEAKGK